MDKASPEHVRELEQQLLTEVKVTREIYDRELHAYADWAAAAIQPLEYAQAHAVGWLQGRARAATRIAGLLRQLRAATGDGEREWHERLARLGITREQLVSTF